MMNAPFNRCRTRPTRPALIAPLVAILCLARPGPAAAPPTDAPWWNDQWSSRKIVRLDLPEQGDDLPVNFLEPTELLGHHYLTGRAVITIEEPTAPLGRDIVVTDGRGEPVPSHAFPLGWDADRATVTFRADLGEPLYYIYYGNPDAPTDRERPARPDGTLMTATIRLGPASGADSPIIEDPAEAARTLANAGPEDRIAPPDVINSIDTRTNPHRLEEGYRYATLYSGLLFTPAAGEYRFAVNAGGTAYLFINGREVKRVSGDESPVGPWAEPGAVRLDEGAHSITVIHGETARQQGIRLGWQPPGARSVSLIDRSAFARGHHVPTEQIGYQKQGRPLTPFFTVGKANVAYQLPDGTVKTPLVLEDRTPGTGLVHRWRVGDATYTERSPRLFVDVTGESRPEERDQLANLLVSLEVWRDGASLGTYERTINLTSLPRADIDAGVELRDSPRILYEDEPGAAAFEIRNRSQERFRFGYRWVRSAAGFSLEPGGRTVLEAVVPAPQRDGERTAVTLDLAAAGRPVAVATVELRRTDGRTASRLIRLEQRAGAATPVLSHRPDHVVYHGRSARVQFGVANPAARPAGITASARLSPGRVDDGNPGPAGEVTLPRYGEAEIVIECPVPRLDCLDESIGLRLSDGRGLLAEAVVRIERKDGQLHARADRMGHRTAGAGRQVGLGIEPGDVMIVEDVRAGPGRDPRLELHVRNRRPDRLALAREWYVEGVSSHSQALELAPGETASLRLPLPEPGPEERGRAVLRLWHEGRRLADLAVEVERTSDGGLAGTVARRPATDDGIAPVEVRVAPRNVVPQSERAMVTFRASNPTDTSARLTGERFVPVREVTTGEVDLTGGERRIVEVPLPIPTDRAGVTGSFSVWAADTALGGAGLRVVRPDRDLRQLDAELGHLVDRQGRKATLVLRPEDPAEHRRWAPIKWLAGRLRSRPSDVLFYGDPMTNPSQADTPGHTDVLAERLMSRSGAALTVVENRRAGPEPTLADLPAFAAALAEHQPDLVIISPGSSLARTGVAPRALSRSLHAMVEVARDQPAPPRVVLVAPPPLVSHPEHSAALAEAVRNIARRHRLPFADLHRLITAESDWRAAYREPGVAADGLYLLYPNAPAQAEMAEAILNVLP